MTESAIIFDCEGTAMVGILHRPSNPSPRGLVIVVGGPQTRVGSHRQFVLLARTASRAGVAVLRFDYRGMGDSGGAPRNFTAIEADIRSAIDNLCAAVPVVREVVLWGLCDAASAILFYAGRDPRVAGIALVNPWARTMEGVARALLREHYLRRILDAGFWRKVVRGEFAARKSIVSFGRMLGTAFGADRNAVTSYPEQPEQQTSFPLRERMLEGLRGYRGRVLLLLSGDDLTAREFKDMVTGSRSWRRLLARRNVARCDLAEANHTFSRTNWREQVAAWTLEWMRAW